MRVVAPDHRHEWTAPYIRTQMSAVSDLQGLARTRKPGQALKSTALEEGLCKAWARL